MLKLSKATVNSIRRDIERSGEGYRLIYESIFKEKGSRLNQWLEALRFTHEGVASRYAPLEKSSLSALSQF